MKKLILILIVCCVVSVCKSQNKVKTNSVYVQFLSFVNPTLPTINFEKIVRINSWIGAGVCFGAVSMEDYGIQTRVSGSLVLGGPKHSFQPEIVVLARGFTIFVFDYKFQTRSGFYIKGGITTRVGTVPTMAIGYAF